MADIELSTLGSVIKTAYEGEADTNAFDDAAVATLSSALQDVVDDTTPQLGGDLDVNGQEITATAANVITDGLGLTIKVATANAFFANASGFYPANDGTVPLGLNGTRWSVVYGDRLHANEYVYWSDTLTVGSLPAATTGNIVAAVSDALAPVNGSVVVGGGGVDCLVYSDGTNWIVVTGGTTASAVYNNQTGTTYTVLASDNGKIITFDNAAACAVTLPDTLDTNFQCTIVQVGAGVPTVTPATDTINGAGTGVAPSAQWKGMYLSQYSATNWLAIL